MITSDAEISDCGQYRWWLTRWWNRSHNKHACWIMLNPSTADAANDDPTIRRCISFSREWGMDGLSVVNLFALRATNPKELAKHHDPIGEGCTKYAKPYIFGADVVVCAWGNHGDYLGRGISILEWLRASGIEPMCLGMTSKGQPKHPLYIKSGTKLEHLRWSGNP